jgi:hypothetical protein
MAAKDQKVIISRIRSLTECDDVTITVTSSKASIHVTHRRKHVPNMVLKWAKDHYIGYMLNDKNEKSHAIISLWTPLEASQFTAWYMVLVDLAARRM